MPAKDLHPDLTPEERQQLFQQGIELFNRGEFFECHEAFEEIWRSTTPEPRDFFQGVIQVAVGLYHYRVRHRADVALRVLVKGRRRLERVTDHQGLDVELLLRQVAEWEAWLETAAGESPTDPRLVMKR